MKTEEVVVLAAIATLAISFAATVGAQILDIIKDVE